MSAATRIAGRAFYPHVEGLRGVAALYVFVFHIWQLAVQHAGGPLTAWYAATPFLQYGHFAVAIFIVISGYCLALPVAARPGLAFSVRSFFAARARRLLPAYLAVVLLSVPVWSLAVVLRGGQLNAVHIAIAALMHIALIHNLFYATTEYLNGPLWSIGLESQIYVVFALLLIPLWRRFGLVAQLAAALAIGFFPHFVLHSLDWTWPWLCGLFAMGVVAASLTARGATSPRQPWTVLAYAAAVVAVVAIVPFHDGVTEDGALWPADLALGAAVALFFVAASRDDRMLPARLLALRPVVLLGTFSYSLYLIHAPLVDLTVACLLRWHANTAVTIVAYGVLIPAVVALAYGFYRVFERPFMSKMLRTALDVQA
ncbi:MAG: acyltransferase, partial [Candidatus Eremiobacteraeota bacterium]|nr:acyltransferase [Candidatus Eremiobacteraeota bacterium]